MKIKIVTLLVLTSSFFLIYFINNNHSEASSSNSIRVIMPYKFAGTWVFDDENVGLIREPFVAGTPKMIDQLVSTISNASEGFRLTFSTQKFPEYDLTFKWLRADGVGNWYFCEQYNKEGWLCPGLFKYYKKAPEIIYIKAESK